MISGVYVSGFRGIREGRIDSLRQVTLLVGKNGAGKSSILEALYLASAYVSAEDEVRKIDKLDYIVHRRGGRGGWDEARRFLWHMGDVEAPIKICLDIKDKIFEFEVVDLPKKERPIRHVQPKTETPGEKMRPKASLAGEGVPTEVYKLLRDLLFVDENLVRNPATVETYAWPRVLTKRLDKLVVEIIREEFEPDAEGLTYAPSDGGYYLMLQTARTAIRIDDLGDGARAALLTTTLILAYKPTVLLIEEPELHMHPAGLYAYMKILTKLAKEMGFQVIATTHSIDLIQIAQALSQEVGIDVSAIYLEREEGILKARNFAAEDVELLKKLGIDIRLLYKF